MSFPLFDIIFRGDIVFGHQLVAVKVKLQQLFKADAAKIDSLFTGRPVALKRNLDEATANKYRDALVKAGAMVEVCPSDTSPANGQTRPVPVVRRVASAAAVASGWTLAPLGADLLPARERLPKPTPLDVDVSHLSLRAAEGNLVDATELHKVISVPVMAPDLGLAAVGADLISTDEKLTLPPVEIEIEGWEIVEAGTGLLYDHERPIVPPAIVAMSDYGVAPVGSDLGQLKPSVKPVIPDISGLRLVDSGG